MRSVRSAPVLIKTILLLNAVVAFPVMVARRLAHAPENFVDAIEKFARSN